MHDFPMSETMRWLIECKTAFINGFGGSAAESLEKYQRKTTELSRGLGSIFSFDDLQKMLLTRRHWLLMEMLATSNGPTIHELIGAETTDRQRYFEALVQQYTQLEGAWKDNPVKIVVADTNVYEHNEQYWDEVPWAPLAGASAVRLMVPMAVVRELDKHKRTDRKNKVSDTNDEDVRTRARVSTRRLREKFIEPSTVVSLATPGATAELIIDAPDHRPNDDADAEIIDRALAVQRLTERKVALMTGDGNMQFAARSAGLDVINVYEVGH